MCTLQNVPFFVELGSANRLLVNLRLVSILVLREIENDCE